MAPSGEQADARIRMTRTGTWSVLAVSFAATLGMLICVAVTLPPLWALQGLLHKELWPSPEWVPPLATCAVVAVPVAATLCAALFNLTSRCSGGLVLTLTGDTATPAPFVDQDAGDRAPAPAADQDADDRTTPDADPDTDGAADADGTADFWGPAALDPVHPVPAHPPGPSRDRDPDHRDTGTAAAGTSPGD
ncbi:MULTISPECIES: hypothetical protein [Streptomyces]|uniref:Uncharacterized protein n=1 Tax=Streptomyces thermoviolaceus subsp. thermoviolaceus TaxID=66860 RepID=A0ABX0YRL3_STRTL|nr:MULTISPECIES: hypothetical protein [Streptomyces]NJP13640.1 hypothetical protein [Streptomyces thermoviolaceus subsp. thermoviolaceus]RSS03631.1 hypothetical protein EF917_12875 [Streptomyces sp. WAC00469]GHA75355.1 hypothetical protein GCM10010512_02110 [Streptomyces thermoviolaceus subsp. thermoviolaceus]